LSVPGIDSWYHEKESAWLYRRVAAAEPDPKKRELFLQLATAAEEQAGTWQRVAREGGAQSLPERLFTPSLRARVVAALLRHFEVRSLRMVLAAMKVRGLSVYSAPQATAGHPMPTSLAEVGARHRHAFGGSLRAIVFGVNDGLVSNVSLVLGVAGAGVSSAVVLTTGAAGLLAGALSMAAGEYVSVRSQREMYEHQIALEREELAAYPQEEAEELALIYHARGVELQQARTLSQALLADPAHALDVLAREELGLNPDDLGSPWGGGQRLVRDLRRRRGGAAPAAAPRRERHARRARVGGAHAPRPVRRGARLVTVYRARRPAQRPAHGADWRRGGRGVLPGGQGARRRRRLVVPRVPAA
jgi:VIT1/CCC1 family predicted Fe2+/Mn2+ transporter